MIPNNNHNNNHHLRFLANGNGNGINPQENAEMAPKGQGGLDGAGVRDSRRGNMIIKVENEDEGSIIPVIKMEGGVRNVGCVVDSSIVSHCHHGISITACLLRSVR
jgi:hypothetical protein